MGNFHGVVPALITPFDAEGRLNEEAYRGVMEHNIQAGVDGFWITGGTGESVLLSEEEVIRIAPGFRRPVQGQSQDNCPRGERSPRRAPCEWPKPPAQRA